MKRPVFMAAAAIVMLNYDVQAVNLNNQQENVVQYMSQHLTLAQLKAQAEADADASTEAGGIMSTISQIGTNLLNVFFGTGKKGKGKGKTIPPKNEYMGCEVNLLSANKNQEGKGAGGQSSGGGGTDAWLGGMPGLKQFGPIFQGQTESEIEGAGESSAVTEGEVLPPTTAGSASKKSEVDCKECEKLGTPDAKSETSTETSTESEALPPPSTQSTTKKSEVDCKECEKLGTPDA